MIIQKFKKLLSKGKLQELFYELEIRFVNTELGDLIILFKNTFVRCEQDNIRGLLTREEYNVEISKINSRILNFLKYNKEEISQIIDQEQLTSKVLKIKEKLNYSWFDDRNDSQEETLISRLRGIFESTGKQILTLHSKYDFNNLNEESGQLLEAIFNKSQRRIEIIRKFSLAEDEVLKDSYQIFLYNLDELIKHLDIPQTAYSEEEIKALKEIYAELSGVINSIKETRIENLSNLIDNISSGFNENIGIVKSNLENNKSTFDSLLTSINRFIESNNNFTEMLRYKNENRIYSLAELERRKKELFITFNEIKNTTSIKEKDGSLPEEQKHKRGTIERIEEKIILIYFPLLKEFSVIPEMKAGGNFSFSKNDWKDYDVFDREVANRFNDWFYSFPELSMHKKSNSDIGMIISKYIDIKNASKLMIILADIICFPKIDRVLLFARQKDELAIPIERNKLKDLEKFDEILDHVINWQ